jgi:hypothetical protein
MAHDNCKFRNESFWFGCDSVCAPLAAAIAGCIIRGGSPKDVLPNASADEIAEAARAYELCEMAFCHSNLEFIKLFCGYAADQDRLFPLAHIAIEHFSDRAVLAHLAEVTPLSPDDAGMLIGPALTAQNVVALDWLYEINIPPPPDMQDAHQRLLFKKNHFGARYWTSVLRDALELEHHSVVAWLTDETRFPDFFSFFEQPGAPGVLDTKLVLPVLECVGGLPLLLKRYRPEVLYAVDPSAYWIGTLQCGCTDLLDALRLEPISVSSIPIDSIFARAATGGAATLEQVATMFSPDRLFPRLEYFHSASYDCERIDSIQWILKRFRHDPCWGDFASRVVRTAARYRRFDIMDHVAGIKELANKEFWQRALTHDALQDLDIFLWYEKHCSQYSQPILFLEEEMLRKTADRVWTEGPAPMRVLFDRVPPSALALVLSGTPRRVASLWWRRRHAELVVRMWWQYQRAKLGVLIICQKHLSRPGLPDELYRLVAENFLNKNTI